MPVIKVQQLSSEDFRPSGIAPPMRAHERITKQHWWEFDSQEGAEGTEVTDDDLPDDDLPDDDLPDDDLPDFE